MRTPSILFINRVYPPGEGATGRLLEELSGELAQAGWAVTVLAAQDSGGGASSLAPDGVRVERVRALTFVRTSLLSRMVAYACSYPKLFWMAVMLPRHDFVITLTDPPLLVILGLLLQVLRGSHHLHWAQDIYPEVAEELGVLKKGGVAADILRWMSTFAMRRAEAVIAVGQCMKERLSRRGVPPERIHVIPNWAVNGVGGATEEAIQAFRAVHGWADRCTIMYSGNFGLAHDFSGVVDAAAELQSPAPEVLFVFVGEGAQLASLRQDVQRRGLKNVRFLPSQSPAELPVSLAAADVHVACMRAELLGLVVPSKVYGILAAGRPCIFAGPAASEAAQALLREKSGAVVNASDGPAIARRVLEFQRTTAKTRSRSRSVNDAAREFANLVRQSCRVTSISQNGLRADPGQPALTPHSNARRCCP